MHTFCLNLKNNNIIKHSVLIPTLFKRKYKQTQYQNCSQNQITFINGLSLSSNKFETVDLHISSGISQ